MDLAADEIITAVTFSPVKSAAYAKLHQRASHFAIVGVAAALDVKNGVIQSAHIGLTGATSHATRLTDVEKALEGQRASAAAIETAARIAGAALEDINSDLHASSDYRRAMVQVFCERALKGGAGARRLTRRRHASFDCRHSKNRSSIIFATEPISR